MQRFNDVVMKELGLLPKAVESILLQLNSVKSTASDGAHSCIFQLVSPKIDLALITLFNNMVVVKEIPDG